MVLLLCHAQPPSPSPDHHFFSFSGNSGGGSMKCCHIFCASILLALFTLILLPVFGTSSNFSLMRPFPFPKIHDCIMYSLYSILKVCHSVFCPAQRHNSNIGAKAKARAGCVYFLQSLDCFKMPWFGIELYSTFPLTLLLL